MDEEIDLRSYVLALGRNWKMILIIVAVALVVAVVGYFLWPPTYEAIATVGVAKPRYVLDFDVTIRSALVGGSDLPLGVTASKAYVLMADNDELVSQVIQELGDLLSPGERNLREIRSMVSVSGDVGVLQFACENRSPDKAAGIATAWAQLYVRQLNGMFSTTADNATVLEKELQSSRQAVLKAESDKAEFLGNNTVSYLESQLEASKQAMSDRLSLAERLNMIKGDAMSLRTRLATQSIKMPTLGSQLHTLFLEATAFGPEVSLPVQLQLPLAAEVESMSASEMAVYLDGLIASLQARQKELREQAAETSVEVAALERQLETVHGEENRLTAIRDVARETYSSLARKVDENRVTQAIQEPEVRLVSGAAVPTEPTRIELPLLLGLSVGGGLLVGLLAALVAEYIRPAHR